MSVPFLIEQKRVFCLALYSLKQGKLADIMSDSLFLKTPLAEMSSAPFCGCRWAIRCLAMVYGKRDRGRSYYGAHRNR